MVQRTLAVAALLLLFSCSAVRPATLHSSRAAGDERLLAIADRFYAAGDVKGMKAAVDEALALAPTAALSHELAAQYAWLRGDEVQMTEELLQAVSDLDDPDALLHLKLLFSNDWSHEQALRIGAVLDSLSTQSPSPEVRAYAAFRLATLREDLGGDVAAAEARINGRLPLAVVGPWDNDQGKGFDMPQPPETEGVDPSAEYPGVLRPVRWRPDLPVGTSGVYLLGEALEPSRFTLAYATGTFALQAPSKLELRLRTSEPFKLWVDGALVASVQDVREVMFDQVVVPFELAQGNHRVLVKSARRDEGSWLLSMRVTGPRGAELAGLSMLPPLEQRALSARPKLEPVRPEALVDARVAHLDGSRLRTRALRAVWWRQMFGGPSAVREAEALSSEAKDSVFARYNKVLALWAASEHGRASDILSPLAGEVGGELVGVAAAQARLWSQQGLRQKARAALVALAGKHPDSTAVTRELQTLFDAEDWLEDECAQRGKLHALLRGAAGPATREAACQRKLSRHERAEELLLSQLRLTPRDSELLTEYFHWALERGREERAEWAARELLKAYPYRRAGYLSLATALERREEFAEAEATLRRLMALAPDSAAPWTQLARMEYRRGDKAKAIAAWREALARNPDDEKLANRLDFLAPEAPEAWMADVPDEKTLEELVEKARALKPEPGANYAYVLDHEVAQYKPDGTVVALVTEVLQAFNAEGRDALLKRSLGGHRVRMRVAYAIDADGRRVEPASVRDGMVRFRALGEHSTVVLQYRRDTSPRGYLARHLSYSWTFQGLSDQRERASLVLYVPKDVKLHEQLNGVVEREEREVGAQRRLQWTASKVKPAGFEVGMPPSHEVNASLMLSTIPSWDVFAKWTEALFQDAVRESPEVRELADRLLRGVTDPNEKLLRIQAFLMKEIRYEQDYESMIAGVKPHPAPMVLERKYGDCKDKVVLFITLARLAGLETHYALIRTRDWGKVKKEVPQQQFNHVIVYVPKQPGIEQDRYFDPTADALDLVTLRTDVVGTTSYVMDPKNRSWQFREVPFQSSDANNMHAQVNVALSDDGSGVANVSLQLVGNEASSVRRMARNPEQFGRFLQHYANNLFAGSQMQSRGELPLPDDVRNPAHFAVDLAARTAAKREGSSLRFVLPRDVSPAASFKLSSRKYPLVMNVPRRYRWSGTVSLPTGLVARVPPPVEFKSPCIDYQRKVVAEQSAVRFDHQTELKCERIEASAYPDAMKAAVEVQRLMDEDVVFDLAPAKKPKGPVQVSRPAP